MKTPMTTPPNKAELQHLADQCVKCGMCLPHCATYAISQNENESPRGRISLAQGLLQKAIEPQSKALEHLDHCLNCRACENICPSGVDFAHLINNVRGNNGQRSALYKKLAPYFEHPARLAKLHKLALLYQYSGVQKLVRLSGIINLLGLTKFDRTLPQLSFNTKLESKIKSAQPTARGQVILFKGCVARYFDTLTLQSAARILSHLGYEIQIPEEQTCCGALHLHHGDLDVFNELAQKNTSCFNKSPNAPVISCASGCGATLLEYHRHGQVIENEIQDISTFILKHLNQAKLTFKPYPKRIGIHDPCTLKNVMKAAQAPHQLLKHIPNAEIVALPDNHHCCGAAGSYNLEFPEISDAIVAKKLKAIENAGVDVIVSSNIGCQLHLQNHLKQAGMNIPIYHPVTLLNRLLNA